MAAVLLADYLDRAARAKHDCCTFMAGWLIENGLPDPMCDRRGSYASPRQYLRLIRREGGIVASCARRFAAIGLSEAPGAAAGDVAIVQAPIMIGCGRVVLGLTGAICVSATMRAVVASDAALAIANLPTIKAWSLQ